MRTFVLALAAVSVVLFSQEAMQAARSAAEAFVSGVMPALFPMMVISRLWPGKSGSWLGCAAFSFAAGSPAAAARVGRMWEEGQTDEASILPLAALTGVMSPMFFTGTLARWTGDAAACRMLLAMHDLSAVIVWAALRLFFRGRLRPGAPSPAISLPQAIARSMEALLSVLGAMMLFSIAAGVAGAAGIPMDVLWPVLEIGGGMAQAAGRVSWPVMGALCSFGGLSVWLQNMLFLDQAIGPVKLLLIRLLHGAVCYALCLFTFA